MRIIGVDLHTRQQSVAMLDTDTAADPTFRLISSQRNLGPGHGADLDLALVRDRTADQGRESDRADGVNRETLGRAESLDSSDRVVLDMDSSESPV
jgi:hypothetical protein